MSKKILFSPIGGTDPIKYLRDGSMLHICRHYQPDVVYLYLSHEMMEYHRKDNRYVDALNRLGTYLNHHFDTVLIERDALIDVQQYDIFYKDFREEIRKIENMMAEDDELLINMASGTPAMKSALMVMATLAEYRFKPVQVSTPQGKMNSEHDDREDYDSALNWELNEDNAEDAPNRCTEVECFNLIKMLKIEAIKKHIMAYDYAAALAVATEIQQDISEDAYCMLKIADARAKLNLKKISTLADKRQYNIYPIKEGDKQKIFEYALVLQMKIDKQEYCDFIRGLTPLVVDLLEVILKKECGITLSDCCTESKDGLRKWDRQKLTQLGLMPVLDSAYANGFKGESIYSTHIAKLIEAKSSDTVLIQKVNDIVNVERTVRNPAAHAIVSVTDEWIKHETQKTSREIMSIIKYLVIKSGINAKETDWKSYDDMNKEIEKYLR